MHLNDKRKRLLAIVAHCILNQNTVVKPLASHEGAVKDLVNALVELGYGIIQLPCPEVLYLGTKRWWMSREQYDVELYKEFSRKILKPYIMLLKELTKENCRYLVIGVRGSPSCATKTTTSNPNWQGEPRVDNYPKSTKVECSGIFVEVFLEMIKDMKLPQPVLTVDVDHREIAEKGVQQELLEHLTKLSREIT